MQCKACHALTERAWLLGTDWVHKNSKMPPQMIIIGHLLFAGRTQASFS